MLSYRSLRSISTLQPLLRPVHIAPPYSRTLQRLGARNYATVKNPTTNLNPTQGTTTLAPDAPTTTLAPDAPTITSESIAATPEPIEPTLPTDSNSTESPPPAAETAPAVQESLAEQFLSMTEAPPTTSSSTRSNRPLPKGTKSQSSIEKTRARLTRSLLLGSLLGSIIGAAYLGREWDSLEEEMKLVGRAGEDGRSFVDMLNHGGYKAAIGRGGLRAVDAIDYLNKPAWEPLIPPPLPEPHGRPLTLIVDLDDLLVHSSWDIENGWRTAKRPGVDYFLAYLSQFYEIVLFTTQPAYTAAPIVEKLDPYGAYIPWKLFRESTRYKNKSLIKDLSYLGRDLSKVVMLDTNPDHVQLNQNNSILLTPWVGSRNDATSRELISLIPFLEALAINGVKDVREVIGHYQGEGKHIPTAYAEAEEKMRESKRIEWEAGREKREGKQKWIKALVGALGGGKTVTEDKPPELFIEKVRKNAQRMYLEEQKYWKDNEATIKRQMDEDRERQLKEMKGSLLGFMGLTPPPAA